MVFCLKLICDGFYFTELVDVILIRITQPEIGTDSVLILVMLRSTVSVFLK